MEDNTIERLSTELKSNPSSFSENANHFSSYYLECHQRPENVLHELYREITNHVLKNLTLSNRVEHWGETYWMQVYPPGSKGHGIHDHFTGNEAYSWVHFLRPIKKSFYFLIDGNKVYPKQQNPGDYIVFPSWALHGVDTNESSQERVVIAGNLILNTLIVNYSSEKQKITRCHKINRNVLVWETIDDD